MAKTPKVYRNECPECHAALDPELVLSCLTPAQRANCGPVICTSCLHLVAASESLDGNRDVELTVVPRDWFLTYFTEQDRVVAHEVQEKMHHDRGHWG